MCYAEDWDIPKPKKNRDIKERGEDIDSLPDDRSLEITIDRISKRNKRQYYDPLIFPVAK